MNNENRCRSLLLHIYMYMWFESTSTFILEKALKMVVAKESKVVNVIVVIILAIHFFLISKQIELC